MTLVSLSCAAFGKGNGDGCGCGSCDTAKLALLSLVSWEDYASLDAESASRDMTFLPYHYLVLSGISFVRSFLRYHDWV